MLAPLLGQATHLQEYDSIGVKTVNGKAMITHRVRQGETLYSLARRYGVRVDDILSANPGMSKSLKIDQLVNIPYHREKTQDSAGAKTGVAFHVVKPSETLFSISRQYGISIDDLRRWNNLKSDALSPGMKLAVSNGMPASVTTEPGMPSGGKVTGKIHIVKPSETLFAISRQYGVTVQQIKEWNHLSGNALDIGQKLIVSAPGKTVMQEEKRATPLPEEVVAVEKPEKERETKTPEAAANAGVPTSAQEQEGAVTPEVSATSDEAEDDVKTYEPAEKTIEHGMAEVIDDASDSRKYLALHRTAPIGTIMQIKNEMNDQIVFVRVVGRIPDTGDNSKVLIKISKKAYDRLGALDKRFPVVISYVK